MGRINSIFAAVAAMAMSRVGGTHRTAAGTKHGRQMVSIRFKGSRSKYRPHIGKKEQERAKRCYMVNVFGGPANPHNKSPRSAPTLSQAARPYPF